MNITLINQLTSLIGLFGVAGSIFYFVLIKIGLPRTKDGKTISRILTFFSVLIVYGFFNLINFIFKNQIVSYISCVVLIVLMPFVFSKVINKMSESLNDYSNILNGFHHEEGTPLLQFLEEKIDGVRPEKYIIVFNSKNEFITSGYMDKLSDQDDVIQQIQLIGDYVPYTFDKAVERYNDPKQEYFEDNKMIYDYNKELKIFCFNE